MTLYVKPISALLTRDTQIFSNMDPYVVLIVGNEKQKTRTHKQGGKKPKWDQVLKFKPTSTTMTVTVYDEDTFSDDTVGYTKIDLQKYITSQVILFLEYFSLLYKNKSAGKIYMSLLYNKAEPNQGSNNHPFSNTNSNWNNQPQNNNNWNQTQNNGWNNANQNPSGWGNVNANQNPSGWGNVNANQNPSGWGNIQKSQGNLSGWGNNNNNWGNNNNGWGNQQQNNNNNNGWGNQQQNNNNNGWGNNNSTGWGPNNNGWGDQNNNNNCGNQQQNNQNPDIFNVLSNALQNNADNSSSSPQKSVNPSSWQTGGSTGWGPNNNGWGDQQYNKGW